MASLQTSKHRTESNLGLSAWLICTWLISIPGLRADWPMLHGSARHDGFADVRIEGTYRLGWALEFEGERLGTAMEPIVGNGRVFVATHHGNLYALDADTGTPLWRFSARGPLLHSPALAQDRVIAASMDGRVYALEAGSGKLLWARACGGGGFAAAPVVDGETLYLGDRAGTFHAVELRTGRVRWRAAVGAPIRQTAALDGGRVFVTAEDLRVRCFDSRQGRLLWTSEVLSGQTARDYYPMIVQSGARSLVIVRTGPGMNMAQRIARDRSVLARNAGADDSDWRKLDAWIKSDAARGTPELWAGEEDAVRGFLESEPEARTFFVLDAATGHEAMNAAVLWVGGCQGVGAMPAQTAEGRLLIFNRSAYGNWNHGVAPLVGLGELDLDTGRIDRLFHREGRQPPWNTFWGTADESQNFVVAQRTALIVHQGTLSGFELDSGRLFRLWGERDTFGGFVSPVWARNEWHGPARGGVALDRAGRIFWFTGSRVLSLVADGENSAAGLTTIRGADVAGVDAAPVPEQGPREVRRGLREAVEEVLSRRWAPLAVEPGLAGRQFFFEQSGDLFEALALAYPHLSRSLQTRVRERLGEEWDRHPPFSREAWYPLGEGSPRENFAVSEAQRVRTGNDRTFHPFGNLHVVRLYAERCGEAERMGAAWSRIKAVYDDFVRSGWALDAAKGDLWGNRYVASLFAMADLAGEMGDAGMAEESGIRANRALDGLAAWWHRAADELAHPSTFEGVRELDPFIGKGSGLSFSVFPHRHKIALFKDLTPDLVKRLESRDERAADWMSVALSRFSQLHATWWLSGEERQVHFGENLFDPPDLALDAFRAHVALGRTSTFPERARHIDIPWCRADLHRILKVALALEAD